RRLVRTAVSALLVGVGYTVGSAHLWSAGQFFVAMLGGLVGLAMVWFAHSASQMSAAEIRAWV
ncbi:MAG: hypothetical protein ABJD68_11825, partial [Nakamurella sp.]